MLVTIKAEYAGKVAQIHLSLAEPYLGDGLVACGVKVTTGNWRFESPLLVEVEAFEKCKEDLRELISGGKSSALLESYTEEGFIRWSMVNLPQGRVVIEGNLNKPEPTADIRIFGAPAGTVGHLPAGGNFFFGGFETDQSFVQQTVRDLGDFKRHVISSQTKI